nr:hypothetical protein [uncultured Prevotella sp.]
MSSHNQRILFLIIFSVFVFFDIKARCLLTTDTLALDTMRLSEVVVTASNVIRRRDSDLVLVTRDMRRGSFNTAEMLGKVPGFLYNRSTKSLSYYGEENVKILVDSLEKDAGYIKGLHHLRFDKLDVIPNPKGKYEGYAVLVNLHTREIYLVRVSSSLVAGMSVIVYLATPIGRETLPIQRTGGTMCWVTPVTSPSKSVITLWRLSTSSTITWSLLWTKATDLRAIMKLRGDMSLVEAWIVSLTSATLCPWFTNLDFREKMPVMRTIFFAQP